MSVSALVVATDISVGIVLMIVGYGVIEIIRGVYNIFKSKMTPPVDWEEEYYDDGDDR